MAITRKEALLKSISGGESANVSPITREEQYLSYIAGESNSYPSQPITREEVYLDKIAKSGISSGGSGVNVQSLSVTENGTYTAPRGVAYSPIFVDVETEEIPTQEKTVDITENGTTEITADEGYLLSKATVNVNVPIPEGYIQPSGVLDVNENGIYDVTEKASVNVNVASSGGENRLMQFFNKTLKELNFEDLGKTTFISNSMFANFKDLHTAQISQYVVTVGNSSFRDCEKLSSVIFAPNSACEAIADYAFYQDRLLENINIPDSVTDIGNFAFTFCEALKGHIELNGLRNLGDNAFQGCFVVESISLPEGLTKINPYSFNACRKLHSINIPSTVTYIDKWAFANCYELSEITIPNNVEQMAILSFGGCSSLEKVIILATTPPQISADTFESTSQAPSLETRKYYVPAASVEAYKSATNWSKYADRIFAIEE